MSIVRCTVLALTALVLRRFKTLFADRPFYAFALFALVMAADLTPAHDAAATLGSFDATIDLLLFAAPALALAAYHLIGRVDLLLLAASLPALAALPVALFTRETLPVPNLPIYQSTNPPRRSS